MNVLGSVNSALIIAQCPLIILVESPWKLDNVSGRERDGGRMLDVRLVCMLGVLDICVVWVCGGCVLSVCVESVCVVFEVCLCA